MIFNKCDIIDIKYLFLVSSSFTSINNKQNLRGKNISSIKAKIFLLLFFLFLVVLIFVIIVVLIFFSLSSLSLELKLLFSKLESELLKESFLLLIFKFKLIILILLSASLLNFFKLSATDIHNNSLNTESFIKKDLILFITLFLKAFSDEFNSVFQKFTTHLSIS